MCYTRPLARAGEQNEVIKRFVDDFVHFVAAPRSMPCVASLLSGTWRTVLGATEVLARSLASVFSSSLIKWSTEGLAVVRCAVVIEDGSDSDGTCRGELVGSLLSARDPC